MPCSSRLLSIRFGIAVNNARKREKDNIHHLILMCGWTIVNMIVKKNVQKKVITRNKNTTLKIKKLKNNAVYYVQIRTYKLADGKKVYSAWSKAGQIRL